MIASNYMKNNQQIGKRNKPIWFVYCNQDVVFYAVAETEVSSKGNNK